MTDHADNPPRPLSQNDREAIRDRAKLARERSSRLIAECAQLVADLEGALQNAESLIAMANSRRDALQESVTEFAACVRAIGAPPERAVTMAKEIAANAIEEAASVHQLTRGEAVRELRDDVVRWMIDGYYQPRLSQDRSLQ